MQNLENTIISQFANSPTIVGLINNMNDYIDPSADIDNFFNVVWNVDTAVGFGLDIWGRIVDIPRALTIAPNTAFIGFKEALASGAPTLTDPMPWNQAPWYTRTATGGSSSFVLSDSAYRTLILTKAIANITDGSTPSINRLIRNLFAGRGVVYISEPGPLQIELNFDFKLQPFEIAILTTSGAFPRTSGCSLSVSSPP